MVYESDYSTRRIYSGSGSRPGITTSYSYSPGPVYGLQQFVAPMQMPYADQLMYVPCNQPVMPMQYAAAPVQFAPTPSRHYVSSLDTPISSRSPRSDDSSTSSYSKVYSSTVSSSSGAPGSSKNYSTVTESTTRNTGAGPRSTSYTTESSRSSGDGPGGASYFSSASYKSPYGNNYRTFSYH